MGIDVQTEYSFNDLEPFLRAPASTTTPTNSIQTKKTAERQTCITDTFKERKRKINPDAIEKSKEKRKRENAIIENFKYLKQSFETASKNINQSIHQQSRQNKELSNKNADACSLSNNKISNAPNSIETNSIQNICYEDMDSDDFIDEGKIDSILNEIENEMTKSKTSLNNAKPNTNAYFREKTLCGQNPLSTKSIGGRLENMCSENSITKSRSSNYKTSTAPRKLKAKTPKSNYTFIELLERKLSISDEEDKTEVPPKDNGFSDTIKNQIQKYLTKTQTKSSVPDRNIKMLLNKSEAELPDEDEKAEEVEAVDLDCEILNSPMHSHYPRNEIKEILGGKTCTRENIYKRPTKGREDLIYNQDSKICDSSTYANNIDNHPKIIEVDTKHCDTDMSTTLSLDDKDSRKYSENELKTDDLDDTLILNIDETSEMLTNQDNKEVDYSKENDIICVEDYNFKNENIKCRNNVASIDPEVIIISPTKVSDQSSDKYNIEINNQRSVEKEQNILTKGIVTEGSNNNPSYVVLDNKEFQNLYESTVPDGTAKNLCTDIVQKNTTQRVNDRASHKTALAIEDVRPHLYDPSTVPAQGTTFHDNILAIQDVGQNYYQSTYKDEHLYIQTGRLTSNNHCSDIVLQNRNQLAGNRASHDTILAIENIDSSLYQPTKIDAPENNNYLDIVQKNSNQVVDDNRVSYDKILAIENIGYHHNESPKVYNPLKTPGSDMVLKSRNETEIHNKRLHDETLAIEDSSPNMHHNQAQYNNSICLPSTSNDYPSINRCQNKSSNPLKNLTENKQKHDFVKRYTYSTSKIDVCKKQTPEYCMQVIKKVKMDLDITAIVSRKQNSSQNNYKTDSEEAPSNNKRMKIDELPKQDDTLQNTTGQSNKIIATVTNETTNTSKVNLPAFRAPRPEFPMVNSVIMEPEKVKGEESVNNLLKSVNVNNKHNTCDSLINKNQTINKYDKQIPEVGQEKIIQDNHKDNYEETSVKLRELETGNSPAKGENNIKNILHKYSKILA